MPDFLLRTCKVCDDQGTPDNQDPNGTMVMVFTGGKFHYECRTCFENTAA